MHSVVYFISFVIEASPPQIDWYTDFYYPFMNKWAEYVRSASSTEKIIFVEMIPNEARLVHALCVLVIDIFEGLEHLVRRKLRPYVFELILHAVRRQLQLMRGQERLRTTHHFSPQPHCPSLLCGWIGEFRRLERQIDQSDE